MFYCPLANNNMLHSARPAGSLQTLHRSGGYAEVISLANLLSSPYNSANLNGGFIMKWGITETNETPRHKEPCSRVTHGKWGCQELIDAVGIIITAIPLTAPQSLPQGPPVVVPH